MYSGIIFTLTSINLIRNYIEHYVHLGKCRFITLVFFKQYENKSFSYERTFQYKTIL